MRGKVLLRRSRTASAQPPVAILIFLTAAARTRLVRFHFLCGVIQRINYLELCEGDIERRCEKKLMITSDDVFEHLLKERRKFDVFNNQRSEYNKHISQERLRLSRERVSIDLEDPESIDAYRRRCQVMNNSNSKLIVAKMGVDKKGQSNGEWRVWRF